MSTRSETSRIPDDWPLRAQRYQYRYEEGPMHPEVNTIPVGPPTYDVHAAIEVGVTLSGEHVRVFPGGTFTLRPGEVWMSAMWEPHGWYATAPDTTALVLCFLPDFLGEEMLGDLPWLTLFALPPAERPRVTEQRRREKILSLARDLQEEIAERPAGWMTAVRLTLLHVLLLLARSISPHHLPADPALRAGHLARMMPAINLLSSKPAHRITLPEAAADCGLSASQFARVFHRTFGVSFGRFTLRTRMAMASRLLVSTELSVGEIAAQTGFADGSHLHRMFTRHFSCTPGEYRQQMPK